MASGRPGSGRTGAAGPAAAGTGASGARRRAAGRPGRGGRPARAPGPAVRLPGARRTSTTPPCPGCGCGCASPAGSWTGSCWSGWRSPTTAGAGVGGPGGVARARAHRRGGRAVPGGGRPVRAACWPTCCGWPCRRGTPGSRPKPAPEPPAAVRAGTGAAAPGWARYPRGPALLDALAGGRAAHAVWQALPGEAWAQRLAEAAAAAVAAGRGALLVRAGPARRRRRARRLRRAGSAPTAVVALTAELGPAERYRRWLAVRRGTVRVVVGTRSATFAPVARLGLLAVWDDGDDLHAEPRAPYPHVRDVLRAARARRRGRAAGRPGSRAPPRRSCWSSPAGRRRSWPSGRRCGPRRRGSPRWARPTASSPATRTARAARLPGGRVRGRPGGAGRRAPGAGAGAARRLPALAGLRGPAGRPARCRRCAGPLGLPAGDATGGGRTAAPGVAALPLVRARRAGVRVPGLRVAAAARRGRRGRAHRRGAGPGLPGPHRAHLRAAGRRCSPGAGAGRRWWSPPRAPSRAAAGGYGAALLLDGWALLARPDLRVAEETLRRWLGAAALVVPHTDGGRVVVVAEPR